MDPCINPSQLPEDEGLRVCKRRREAARFSQPLIFFLTSSLEGRTACRCTRQHAERGLPVSNFVAHEFFLSAASCKYGALCLAEATIQCHTQWAGWRGQVWI